MSSCPTFDGAGPSGIAEALRVVDCMSGEAASFAFARLFGTDALLGQALTVALTLYIGFYAIGLLTGRTSLSLTSLTPRMMTLGIALTFATSWVAYQSVIWNLLVGAPDQIASLLIGTQGSATSLFADRLDGIFAVVAQAAAATEAAKAGLTDSWLHRVGSGPVVAVGIVTLAGHGRGAARFANCAGGDAGARADFHHLRPIPGYARPVRGMAESRRPVRADAVARCADRRRDDRLVVPDAGLACAGRRTGAASPDHDIVPAAAVYCALMIVCLKIAATMVAGWRLPFSSSRESKGSTSTANAEVPTTSQRSRLNRRSRPPEAATLASARSLAPLRPELPATTARQPQLSALFERQQHSRHRSVAAGRAGPPVGPAPRQSQPSISPTYHAVSEDPLMTKIPAAFLALALFAVPAHAADPRLQSVHYQADKVVKVQGRLGFQSMIEFGQGEAIENVAVGDSSAWQVTPNKRANLLFLKPLVGKARTNMTVVTDQRTYLFDLSVAGAGTTPLYNMRFTYGATPPAPVAADQPQQQQKIAYPTLLANASASAPAVVHPKLELRLEAEGRQAADPGPLLR